MSSPDKVNILLVDDHPAKLLSYEVILRELGENLLNATSANEALEILLKTEVAVVLVDVYMPGMDGYQLATMIRDHPRFEKTAIIFISAIHLSDIDRLHGYEVGAVDYVPVPVVPEVLRAKVKIFVELYRKTRQLEQLNEELERRVVERTAELEASNTRLRESEQRRSVALVAGQMGSWDWNVVTGECVWDAGQYRIFGVDPKSFELTFDNIRSFIHPEDLARIQALVAKGVGKEETFQTEVRILRPNGQTRWCICAAAVTTDADSRTLRVSGVTVDITERKKAEEHQLLLAREVDHRARNALAVTQSLMRLTRASTVKGYIAAVEGRIAALSRAHTLLSEARWQGADLNKLIDEELAPYQSKDKKRMVAKGPQVWLTPAAAQALALALHELATNAGKYGALSSESGEILLVWDSSPDGLVLRWTESGGPRVKEPRSQGLGTKIIAAMVESQLHGNTKFDWHPEGLRCTLTLPRGNEATQPSVSSRDAMVHDAILLPTELAANKVMLVEDDFLVAMMMKEMLTELGLVVLGPFGTAAEAITAAQEGEFDVAVLDINLRGEPVYPVAELLIDRGVPLIFVSGYGPEGVDKRFANVPILQKPVELRTLKNVFTTVLNDSAKRPRSQ